MAAVSVIQGMDGRFWKWMSSHAVWVMAVIFVLNMGLKLPYLDGTSLFLDEAVAIYDTQGSVGETIAFSAKDPTPPLYYVTLGLWCKVFGISEMSARFPSLLFSAMTTALIFLLGSRHIHVRAGLLGALLFTVSNQGMVFAHEARSYALAGMLMVISYYVFLNIAQRGSVGWKTYLGLVLVNTLLLYTHYLTAMGLGAQALLSLWLLRGKADRFLRYAGSQVAVLILWLPWVFYNRSLLSDSKVTSWLKPPSARQFLDTFIHFAGTDFLRWMGLGVVVAGILGIVYLRLRGKRLERGGFALVVIGAWLLVSLGLQFMVARMFMPVFELRYVLYALPAYFLLIGAMLAYLPGPRIIQYGIAGVVLGMTAAVLNLNPTKPQNWRDAVAAVKSMETPGTQMMICTYYQYVPFAYYYNRDHFRDHENTMDLLLLDYIFLGEDPALVPTIDGDSVTDFILVLSHDQLVDPEGKLLRHAKSKYCIQRQASFEGVKVYQFKNPPCEPLEGSHFKADFETPRIADEASSIIADPDSAHNGNHVTWVGPGQEFSASMTWKAFEIYRGHFGSVEIRLRGKLLDAGKKVMVVFAMQHAGESYNWSGYPLQDHYAVGEWFEAVIQVPVPEVRGPEDKVSLYVWSPDGGRGYFDDMEVSFWEGL